MTLNLEHDLVPSPHGFNSPLRYPGGKGELLGFIKRTIIDNGLSGGCATAEPYAGGASVALGLLFDEVVRTIQLNDIDIAVYSFWKAALDHTEELCRRIYDTPITIEEWRRQKSIFNRSG